MRKILIVLSAADTWTRADSSAAHSKPRWIAGKGNASIARTTRGVNMRGSLIEIADLDAASIVNMPGHIARLNPA